MFVGEDINKKSLHQDVAGLPASAVGHGDGGIPERRPPLENFGDACQRLLLRIGIPGRRLLDSLAAPGPVECIAHAVPPAAAESFIGARLSASSRARAR